MATSVAPPLPATQPRARAPYTSIETLGLLLVAAAPAIMLTVAALSPATIGEDGFFFGATLAVPLIGAALVWRFGTWAKVVGMIAGVLAGLALFWTVFGLAHPASFADFVPGVLIPLGVALTLGGGIAALVAGRRAGKPSRVARERAIVIAALVVVAAAAAGSAAAMALSRSAVTTEGAVTVELVDFAFDREAYTVPAGEPTTVRIHNSDGFVHTFTVPELGIDQTVLPGNDALVEIDAPAGEYTIYCVPHSDTSEHDPAAAGMAARLVVS